MTKAIRFATIRELKTFVAQCSGCDRTILFEAERKSELPEGWFWETVEHQKDYGWSTNEYIWCPECGRGDTE